MDAQWLGLVDYANSLEIQKKHALQMSTLNNDSTGFVLGLEHPSVITLGKRAKNDHSDILWPEERLRESGVEIVATDRGGLATLHNPGQLVIYPILSLKKANLSVREYISVLELSTLMTLKQYGVEARVIEGMPGVFVGLDKIASIGVRVANRVTTHGLAINISNDLGLFQSIQACGGVSRVTSLNKLFERQVAVEGLGQARSVTTEVFFKNWLKHFAEKISKGSSGLYKVIEA